MGAAAVSLAAAPPRVPQAEIPFADHGGVADWRADGDHTIYFEDNHHRWFRATLFAPCFDLPFVEAIGIDAGPTGSLDNFGAVIVKGRRYTFSAFVAVPGPPADKRARGKPHKPS
ncbi:MAG: hypothetical protein KGM17_15635 [Sphingomonadales bacterium]|nr:hypothetical protein [Sphingomonadales bacterium]